MVARDDLRTSELQKLARRVDQLARKVTTGFSSITRGQLRIASNEGLLVQGSAKIEGWLIVTGTERVTGTLSVEGHLVVGGDMDFTGPMVVKGTAKFTGPLSIDGPTKIKGDTDITGDVTTSGKFSNSGTFENKGPSNFIGPMKIVGTAEITGKTSLKNDLEIATGGRLVAGAVTLGATGVISSTDVLRISGTGGIDLLSTTTVGGQLRARGGLDTTGAKNFLMPHPTKHGVLLRHGATESPVSGVEYWGSGVVGTDGRTVVTLPDYFPALVKPGSAVVFVTGRGFSPDWTDITKRTFTVTGEAGKSFTWLVKAERVGGDFPVEEPGTLDELFRPEELTE